MSKRNHDYLYVVVDRFSKMCIFMSCNKQVTTEQTTKLFFQNVWVHFGFPKSIISDRDSRFVGSFWSSLWALMDTKLKKSTSFHLQTDGQTEVVNRTVVHLLRAYCSKNPKLWDEHLHYIQHAYKTRHDKHRVDHNLEVGDEVWLYISKERLKGEGKKV